MCPGGGCHFWLHETAQGNSAAVLRNGDMLASDARETTESNEPRPNRKGCYKNAT
jgi:hypothetical protein